MGCGSAASGEDAEVSVPDRKRRVLKKGESEDVDDSPKEQNQQMMPTMEQFMMQQQMAAAMNQQMGFIGPQMPYGYPQMAVMDPQMMQPQYGAMAYQPMPQQVIMQPAQQFVVEAQPQQIVVQTQAPSTQKMVVQTHPQVQPTPPMRPERPPSPSRPPKPRPWPPLDYKLESPPSSSSWIHIYARTKPFFDIDALVIEANGTVSVVCDGKEVGQGKFGSSGDLNIKLNAGNVRLGAKFEGNAFVGEYRNKPFMIELNTKLWDGYYMQNGRHPMKASFNFGDRPCGIGYDSIGASVWVGSKESDTSFSFTKYYIGKHTISYKGTLSCGETVFSGLYSNSGEFRLDLVH